MRAFRAGPLVSGRREGPMLETSPHTNPRIFAATPSDDGNRPPGLMIRRMTRLGLQGEELEPLELKRLQGNCRLCPCPEQCAIALADESIDLAWQDWRNY